MTRKYSRYDIAKSAWKVALAAMLVHGAACKSTVSEEGTKNSPQAAQPSLTGDGGVGQAEPALMGSGGSSAPAWVPDAGAGSDAGPVGGTRCAELAVDAQWFLTDYCSSCHANGNLQGGFGAVLDVPTMIASKKIVPNDPAGSKIYTFVKTGIMPKSTNKPSPSEIDSLRAWIQCGAPDWKTGAGAGSNSAFMSIDHRLDLMRADLRQFENPTDRVRMRYIDFSHLANAGSSKAEVDPYRGAASLLLNSLSFGRTVVAPEALDKDKMLYRLDLRDYGMDAATWELIVAEYPYAVTYNQDSRLFPYDELSAQEIRDQTGTQIPYIQADWFIAHASTPPLYYDVLKIPTDINALAKDQGVDIAKDIADSQVSRAGFNNSGVALNNRVLERHELPGSAGAFWLSYDFAGNVDKQNVFAHPVDFQQDGGEGFFNLPNGLQAYFLVNKNFVRLDEAPTTIVTDPDNRQGAVQAGVSCMGGCHLNKGVLIKADTLRAHVLATAANANDIEATLQLYPAVADMTALMDWDIDRYSSALASTGFQVTDGKTIIHMVRRHEDVLDIDQVAGSLGIPTSRLTSSLDASPQAFPPEIVALRETQGTIYRQVFDALFGQIVTGLGLGQQIVAGANAQAAAAAQAAQAAAAQAAAAQAAQAAAAHGSGSDHAAAAGAGAAETPAAASAAQAAARRARRRN